MNLKLRLRQWSGRDAGDLEWDSATGRLAGSLAHSITRRAEEAKQSGAIGWGPDFCLTYPITEPLRKPEEFALILDSMGFVLPPELEAVYPKPPADQLDDEEVATMTPAERSRLVY